MMILLKIMLLAFGLSLFGFPLEANAVALRLDSKPQCNMHEVDRLVGGVMISLGDNGAVDEALACLVSLWRKNHGDGTFLTSPALLSVMEANPREFFKQMNAHRDVFGEWLGNLQYDSFTWVHAPPCPLDEKREQLITLLSESRGVKLVNSEMKRQVLNYLSKIRCRQIN
jgi:hypothetical protein